MPTILVADDNSNIQKMVTLALKDQGIDVVAVGNGEAAVRKLPDLRPDLILADIFMPVRSGYEVCEFVKKDQRFAHIPVILLVGVFDPLDDHEVRRVGADGVLKKPFVPPDPLITLVKSMLAKLAKERAPKDLEQPAVEFVPPVGAAPEVPERAAEAEAQPEVEEFAIRPGRVEFREDEKPLAFGELLVAPPAEAEAQRAPEDLSFYTPSHAQTELAETGEVVEARGAAEPEVPSWGGIEAEPRQPAPDEPPIAVELGGEEPLELVTEETPGIPGVETGTLPELAGGAEWLETMPMPTAERPPIAAETEEAGATPNITESMATEPAAPRAETDAVFAGAIRLPPIPEAPAAPHGVEPAEPPGSAGLSEACAAEPGPRVVSFAVPPPVNPELIDAVVEKVLAQLQPQLLEAISREILRPMVDTLLRRELEKNTKVPD